jgi:hypothetical protein
MTKFEGANDPGFEVVTGELRRWVKHLTALKGTSPAEKKLAEIGPCANTKTTFFNKRPCKN